MTYKVIVVLMSSGQVILIIIISILISMLFEKLSMDPLTLGSSMF